MRRSVSTWKCSALAFLLLGSTAMGFAANSAGGVENGTVRIGGVEMTEAQLLLVVFYGFLFVIVLRRRIVG
ncbi:MAG: hypothetical protein KIT83_14270 [Bryobacterales bacterium]|nr:hypothetical protein [Bryobacterales bacterium]